MTVYNMKGASLSHSAKHMIGMRRGLEPAAPHLRTQPPIRFNLSHPLLAKLETCPNLTQFNQVHAQILATGLSLHPFPASRLLKFLTASLNLLPLANLLFSQIKHPDVFSYNLLIKAFSRSPHPLSSISLYRRLLFESLHPNEYTFCFLLGCCSHGAGLWEGRQAHAHLVKHGFQLTVFSSTSLVHMYGDCGAIVDALKAFDQMPKRSSVSWGAAVNACVNNGRAADGLRLLGEMRRSGVEPGNAALVGAVNACAELGDVATGRAVHGYVVASGTELSLTLGTSLIDMYSKCGVIDMAVLVFASMPERNVASWNSLIHGLAIHGYGAEVLRLFEELRRERNVRPNGVTFLGLLQACNHAGLVEQAVTYFGQMSSVYGLEPSVKHFGCMVDLYIRAGRMKEAAEVVKAMPVEPDAAIWGALFGGCSTHGYKELGEVIAAKVMKMAPHGTCGYLLLSDTFARERQWDDVVGVRKMMRDMDIRKAPGCSSISN